MNRHSVYVSAAAVVLLASAGLSRADDDLLRSSLLELKNSMQQMIGVNRDLSDRNGRFRNRILELQGFLQEIKDQKQMLIDKKRNLSGASAEESVDVDSLRRTIADLESQLNRSSKEYLSLQRKLGGKDEEQKRHQSRQDKLNQEISKLKDKKQYVRPISGVSDEKRILRDNLEAVRRKIQYRRQDLQAEQAKSRVPLAELGKIREKRLQQKEKLERISAEWQIITDDQQRLRERIAQNQGRQAQALAELQSEIDALVSREQELKNDRTEFIDFKQNIADGFADEKKDLKRTLDISMENNRELKTQITFLEGALQKLEQLAGTQIPPASGQEQEEVLKKQGDDLRLQHIYIQNQIADKKKEADGLARQAAQIQSGIQGMAAELTLSQKSTVKTLEQEKKKYQQWLKRKSLPVAAPREISYSEDEKQQFVQKAALLQERISALRKELRDLDLERNELRKKQLAGQQEERGTLVNLNTEIKNLEEIEEEMAFLLADVEKKYKASRIDARDLRRDEKQLSEHLSVLEEENQHLQAEVLSLGVALDKAKIKSR